MGWGSRSLTGFSLGTDAWRLDVVTKLGPGLGDCEGMSSSDNYGLSDRSRRRTWLVIDGERTDLMRLYDRLASPTVPYRKFRARLVSIERRRELIEAKAERPLVITQAIVADAATRDQVYWRSGWGASRLFPVFDDGVLHPTVHAFVRSHGRPGDLAMIAARLDKGLTPAAALALPRIRSARPRGCVYLVTQISTGLEYVGLTVLPLMQRWRFHVYAARHTKRRSPLHEAIRYSGEADFRVEILEDGIEDKDLLAERERVLIAERCSQAPQGLNANAGGSLGGGLGKPCVFNGVEYASRSERDFVLADRHGLPPHVVARRIMGGKTLDGPARAVHVEHLGDERHQRQWRKFVREADRGRIAIDPLLRDASTWMQVIDPRMHEGLHLVHLDRSKPFAIGNFEWMPQAKKIEHQTGTVIQCRGETFLSLKALAKRYGVGESTLKNRLFVQGLSPEDAVAESHGPTSSKMIEVDGEIFRSITSAARALADRFEGVTVEMARDRLRRGVQVASWRELRRAARQVRDLS